jgi:hypothetical protein
MLQAYIIYAIHQYKRRQIKADELSGTCRRWVMNTKFWLGILKGGIVCHVWCTSPTFRAVGWFGSNEMEMTWEEAVVALAVVLSRLRMVDWGQWHWTCVSLAGVCVRNLEMHGIRRRDLDRPDIKRRFRDSLIWVDLSQDFALRRLVPSAAMSRWFQ